MTLNQKYKTAFLALTFCLLVALPSFRPGKQPYISPQSMVEMDGALIVADVTGKQLIVFDTEAGRIAKTISLKATPGQMARGRKAGEILVTASEPEGELLTIDTKSARTVKRVPAGHSPECVVTHKNLAFVGNRFSSDISVVDLDRAKEIRRIQVVREPVDLCLSADGSFLLVANALPLMAATGDHVSAVISVINTLTLEKTADILLPNGSTGLKAMCTSPDGKFAYVTHLLGRYQYPTTQLERGWIMANALSVIDMQKPALYGMVLLDDFNSGAANPWDIVCTPDGRMLVTALSGTDEILMIDRHALHSRLEGKSLRDDNPSGYAGITGNDFRITEGIKKRIRIDGKGPRGLAIAGRHVYAAAYFSGTISAISTDEPSTAIKSWPLGPQPGLTPVRLGEQNFHDAGLCFEQWLSCASCHPDGRTDGLNWDLLNDGMGNPKNTKSMVYAHATPPAMATGIRPSAEVAVGAGIKHILFSNRPESDAHAIDAYLNSLGQMPSPYLENGKLSSQARRGELIFKKAGCAGCHSGPYYTDMNKYNVGTGLGTDEDSLFDVPGLNELWRNAPYLYDGRAVTLKEVLTTFNPGDRHGTTCNLTDQEIDDLTAYLKSI